MKKKEVISDLLLVMTAFIWGVAFVAQSVGMDYVGPFTFNAIRNLMAGGVVGLVYLLMNRRKKGKRSVDRTHLDKLISAKEGEVPQGTGFASEKRVLVGGICCGCILFAGATFQQLGIQYTSTGNAGFLTALYIIMVPILGLFIGKKSTVKIWISVIIALVGFYFLSISGKVSINKGDLLMICSAFCFAGHILVIDHFIREVDGVLLSVIQFFIAGLISCIPMGIFESVSLLNIRGAMIPLIYAGVLSSGVGFTLQIVAQKNTNPVIASMLMSLESVFAALAGLVLLHEIMSSKEVVGCVLVFVAIIIAQLPMYQMKGIILYMKKVIHRN